ncbi:MAG: disulfide oxidoreductase [Alphaproteobacteria bacterium]|nr:disulfide oxidoreductase [Alphaproteobacteria bacterium]
MTSLHPTPIAVLGPTNTGKTHYAMERMYGHASGMIGFPLRLLARENYDRAVARLGADKVALITGEEKIIPEKATYFLCTVEAMPLDRRVAFMAIDEVQLAADPERGHVFTDRILNARGYQETLLLGAETIRRVLEALYPGIEIIIRKRMSRLNWSGQKKVTRLPRRSAVVVFSMAEVYQLAELIRRQRGGTAIVMGALSPRTRNAQVEMFQSGEVDYMVATDAIGMGLNMDIDHVALAGSAKFDGRRTRALSSAELAQIAGRAGRHTKDGTFGITETCSMFEDEVIAAIEDHRFPFLTGVYWRNSNLDFRSPDHLLRSLEAPPDHAMLTRKADAEDHLTLLNLLELEDVRVMAHGQKNVELLYEIAQVPDFQNTYTDSHMTMLVRMYSHLVRGESLPTDWVASQISRLDRTDGDIDTIMTRLAHIRTWTYITHRSAWIRSSVAPLVDGSKSWQEEAKHIEDKLSDCLHTNLTQRFVDRRAAILSRRLKDNDQLVCAIRADGTVLVEGEEVGHLDGFTFTPSFSDGDIEKPIIAAARKGLTDEIRRRVQAVVASADAAFHLNSKGQIIWRESVIGTLSKGNSIDQPKADAKPSQMLEGDQLKLVSDRLTRFAADMPKQRLEKLYGLLNESLTGVARGIGFQLFEALGVLPRRHVADMVQKLDEDSKRQLAKAGVRIGVDVLFMPDLLKPAQIEITALLFSLFHNEFPEAGPPPAGRVAIDHVEGVSDSYWLATGYRRIGGRVMRVDMAERLAAVVRSAARSGTFRISEEMLSLAGATREQMQVMIEDLGFIKTGEEAAEDPEKPAIALFERPAKAKPTAIPKAKNGSSYQGKSKSKASSGANGKAGGGKPNQANNQNRSNKPNKASNKPADKPIDPNSPFAVLAKLKAK